MNTLVAVNDEKIFQKIKKEKRLNIIINNIQYKEGILEVLEKNKNIEYIFFDEDLNGQIKIEKLIKKIKEINTKINLIILLNNIDNLKENYLIKNKINFFLKEEFEINKILKTKINNNHKQNKIIAIIGNNGSGKTITTLILGYLLSQNKKVLMIEDNIQNNFLEIIYSKINQKENKNSNNKIIEIKNNLYLFNIKKIINYYQKDKIKILEEINKIENNYEYILIDTPNIKSYKIYEPIIDDTILILNPNLLEINKIKKVIIYHKTKLKVILNQYNENSISKEILENIFKNKIEIITKIKNNINYNLFINQHFNFKYLDKEIKKEFLKIIEKIF